MLLEPTSNASAVINRLAQLVQETTWIFGPFSLKTTVSTVEVRHESKLPYSIYFPLAFFMHFNYFDSRLLYFGAVQFDISSINSLGMLSSLVLGQGPEKPYLRGQGILSRMLYSVPTSLFYCTVSSSVQCSRKEGAAEATV